MEKICVAIVFNHRYDDNISKLKKIYADRFEKVLFLVPFYDGDDSDVIPVYESSHQFHGYFVQAYEKLISTGCDYFLLIADDMILNPQYNGGNLLSKFQMEHKKIGIDSISLLNKKGMFSWPHSRCSSEPFFNCSTSWKSSLPSFDDALLLFRDFSVQSIQRHMKKIFSQK